MSSTSKHEVSVDWKWIGVLTLAMVLIAAVSTRAQENSVVLLDMGPNSNFKVFEKTDPKTKGKTPVGTIDQIDGEVGPATQFTFKEGMKSGYIGRWIKADDSWNRAAGLSFWVKGDGSDNWGGIELIDGNDYALRYAYCFPISSTQWTKITVPWRDFIPTANGPLVDTASGYKPGDFRNFWVGKGYYWRTYPACSFAIDQVALESSIDMDTKDYTPDQPGIPRVLAKLNAGQPITIVTMGDSLTDKNHWANRQKDWNEELVKKLEATYKSKITLVNPAIGGTTLSQNMVLMPRWLAESPHPDLVTICFGANDWDANVRKQTFKSYLNLAVARIRRMTGGSADILIMTTAPGYVRWDVYDELCQAEYEVAKERKTGFADVAQAFHHVGSAEDALKGGYWGWDRVHMGSAGHDLICQTVFAAIQAGGLADLQNAASAAWMNPPAVPAPASASDTAHKENTAVSPAGSATLLSGFEEGDPAISQLAGAQVVTEHATQGTHALQLQSGEKDYASIALQDGVLLRSIRSHTHLLFDVFNAEDHEVALQVSVRDAQSKDYNTRYNGRLMVKPGANTIDFDYGHLARSGSMRSANPEIIRPQDVALIGLFLLPHGNDPQVTLYFDNFRLADDAAQH